MDALFNNRLVRLILVAGHCVLQFVKHIFPFLVRADASSDGVIATLQLKLWSLTLLHSLGVFAAFALG